MARKPSDDNETRMTLGEHLEELRWRMIYALIGLAIGTTLSLIFANSLIGLLRLPYVNAMKDAGLEPDLTVLDVTGAFAMYLKVALISGLVLSSPWVFYQMWLFIGAGLYSSERRYVAYTAPFSALLFAAGVAFFLFVLAEPALKFFIHFSRWMGTRPIITLENHIGFMVKLMLVFGICFQMPLVILMLAWLGIVEARTIARYRRHVIVGILVLAALMTSPSPVDQVGLAVPMYLLFELGVLLARIAEKRREKADREFWRGDSDTEEE